MLKKTRVFFTSKILLVLLLLNIKGNCQSREGQFYFATYAYKTITLLNEQLYPLLSKKEQTTLHNIKLTFDMNDTVGITISSNSIYHTINIPIGLFNRIIQYQLGNYISDNDYYNRKYFFFFYTSFLSFIKSNASIEDEAELSLLQKAILKKEFETELVGVVYIKFAFIYFHEIKHQLQNYSFIKNHLPINLSDAKKDSALLDLEKEADEFAYDKLAALNYYPESSDDVFSMLALGVETHLPTVSDVLKRKQNFLSYSYVKHNCALDSLYTPTCKKISEIKKNTDSLVKIYETIRNLENNRELINYIQKSPSAGELFQLATFYLKGTTINFESNLDSALLCYQKIINFDVRNLDSLEKANYSSFLAQKELAYFYTGKIYELIKKDNCLALENYRCASAFSVVISKEFYDALISRIKDQYKCE